MRLGAQQHPVDRLRRGRVGEGVHRQFDRAAGTLECQAVERPAHAGGDRVPPRLLQDGGGRAADAAQADDGDRLALALGLNHAVSLPKRQPRSVG